jgi:glucose uptake protein GlcU
MAQRCSGNALMTAGLIVTVIGLGIVLARTLAIPREWTTVLIGVALLVAGAARRALRSGTGS